MRIPPPVLALAAGFAQRALTRDASPANATRKFGAVATGAASVAVMGSAAREFRVRGTTVDPLRPERATALVTSGPFRLTRNPMYVGMAGLLAAHMVFRGSTRALIPVAAFVAVIDRIQIPPEEAAMTKLFAAEYEEYRARAPRWVGV